MSTDEEIYEALLTDENIRDIAKRLHVATTKITAIKKTRISGFCFCGNPRRHRGPHKGCSSYERFSPKDYPYSFDTLTRQVDEAVPKGLSWEIRPDVCQEMLVAMLEGQENVLERVQEFIRAYRKEYPFRYGPISLDGNEKLRALL